MAKSNLAFHIAKIFNDEVNRPNSNDTILTLSQSYIIGSSG